MSTGGVTDPIGPDLIHPASITVQRQNPPPATGGFDRAAFDQSTSAEEPDPATEREIFNHATASETPQAGTEVTLKPVRPSFNEKGELVPTFLGSAGISSAEQIRAKPHGGRRARTKRASGPTAPDIQIKNKAQVIFYSKSLIIALQEVVDYDPVRHHNQPRPDLRIDDPEYLAALRELIEELKQLNALLRSSVLKRKVVKGVSDRLVAHVDVFLRNYAKTLGKGAGWLTLGVMAALLHDLGVGQSLTGKIASCLPH